MPKLELGQASNEWPEFLVLLRGERTNRAVLHLSVDGLVGGVKLGLQKCQEEIEEVDTEGICHCDITWSVGHVVWSR